MPSDASVIQLTRPELKADFGSAFYATMCPACQSFLKWKHSVASGYDTIEPGIMKASCCGRTYEMYSETVSIKKVAGEAMPKVNTKQRHHTHLTGTRVLV